jgi:hypothetical protein
MMTPREHVLMVTMFGMFLEAQNSLIDALKSRGVLEGDDMIAFWSIRREDLKIETMERARKLYSLFAGELGVDIGALSQSLKP